MSVEMRSCSSKCFMLAGVLLLILSLGNAWSADSESSVELEIAIDETGETPTPTLVTLKASTSLGLESAADLPASAQSAQRLTPTATPKVIPTDTPMDTPIPTHILKDDEATATETFTAIVMEDSPTVVKTNEPYTTTATVVEDDSEEESDVEEQSEVVATETPTDTVKVIETILETSTDTPIPTPTLTPTEIPTAEVVTEESATAPVETMQRKTIVGKSVGLSPEWFDYLIQAGYLVSSNSEVPRFGIISESAEADAILQPGMHLVVRKKSSTDVKLGDRLMVYRVLDRYNDPDSKIYLGMYVRNLGLLKVTRIDGLLVHADVLKTYAPFYTNDLVKLFDDEMDRWKQSRRKKQLPSDSVECSVAGIPPGSEHALMNETIILGAGEDQGVVAAMDFELKKPVEAAVGKTTWTKIGKARVFFVGGKYSLAKILWSQEVIEKGFRATYQP
jgi:hypothetical protein